MNTPPHCAVLFLLGCLGALAPEIFRLYDMRLKLDQLKLSFCYVLVSTAYAGLGGVWAIILPSVTLYAAFYAGLTMPIPAGFRPPASLEPSPSTLDAKTVLTSDSGHEFTAFDNRPARHL